MGVVVSDPAAYSVRGPPALLTPALLIIHRVIAGFLRKQAGLQRAAADTGAVTLIQRFGSAANLNIYLHCLVLDGVYQRTGGEPDFQAARACLNAFSTLISNTAPSVAAT